MKFRGKSRSINYIVLNILGAAILSILVFIYLFSAYKVIGDSMTPGLSNGDRIIIANPTIINEISRFDIVVIKVPGLNKKKLVKRIIGLPGESIEIRKGKVYINNTPLKEQFLSDKGDVIFRSINMDIRNIPGNCFFMLGDYRERSIDSRKFGPIHRSLIIGRTLFKYWPLSKLGIIK